MVRVYGHTLDTCPLCREYSLSGRSTVWIFLDVRIFAFLLFSSTFSFPFFFFEPKKPPQWRRRRRRRRRPNTRWRNRKLRDSRSLIYFRDSRAASLYLTRRPCFLLVSHVKTRGGGRGRRVKWDRRRIPNERGFIARHRTRISRRYSGKIWYQ